MFVGFKRSFSNLYVFQKDVVISLVFFTGYYVL